MKNLVLIDGSSYLFRSFYALPDLRTDKGHPTSVILGVLKMIKKFQKEYPYKHFACVFDPKGGSFRNKIYKEYKSNRSAMPVDLSIQIKPLFDCIKALGIPLIIKDNFEADDIIGTLAIRASKSGANVIISTGDKDMAQLVSDKIILIDTMKDKIYDKKGVLEKFGVHPYQMIDYQSLVGDSADNVPGVKNVGAKTAARLLNEFGSITEIRNNVDKLKGKLKENLKESFNNWLPIAKSLVTIKTDVDIKENFEDLKIRKSDPKKLKSLFEEFELKTFLYDLKQDNETKIKKSKGVYKTILKIQDLDDWVYKLNKSDMVSIDTETTGLDPLKASIVGISMSLGKEETVYIPINHNYMNAPKQIPEKIVFNKLLPFFEDENITKIGQNLKYDFHVLLNHGVRIKGKIEDTLLQSYIIDSNQKHNLDDLAKKYLLEKTTPYEEICGKGSSQISFSEVDVDLATKYAGEDADVTFRLYQHFNKILKKEGNEKIYKIYNDIEIPLLNALLDMERHGVLIDPDLLKRQSIDLDNRIMEIEKEVHKLAGQNFNLGSPKQLREILYNKSKLPVIKKTPKGEPSTNESVLQQLANNHPLPKNILSHRSLSKLKSTYTDKLPKMIDISTGRVHTNYAQTIAITGRLSSNNPNLQNIPIKTSEGRKIREAFIAPSGKVIISADYSQIELRIMAHLSKDKKLINAFNNNEDVHSQTATEIFNVENKNISPEQRRYAKIINFGLIYGMSAYGLSTQLNIDRNSASNFIKKYFERYPDVSNYMTEAKSFASNFGYVETIFGRKLHLPDIKSTNYQRRQAAERAAINAPMQGSAADLIKKSMMEINNTLTTENFDSKLIMQVHDELILEVSEKEIDKIKEIVKFKMENVYDLQVPLIVEIGEGNNWGEAH